MDSITWNKRCGTIEDCTLTCGPPLLESSIYAERKKLPSLLQRDRSANLAHGFRLLDADQKGFIVDSDLQRLAEDMGDTMSVSDAQAMIETSIQYVSSDQRDGQNQLELDEFRRIFAPPSP